MKFKLLLVLVSLFTIQISYSGITLDNGIKPEDQKYYKNGPNEGMNQWERLNSTVKEINNLHGQIAELKSEINILKKEVEELKKSR